MSIHRGFAALLLAPLLLVGCQSFNHFNEIAVVTAGPYVGVVAGEAIENFDLPSGLEAESAFTYGARAG